MKGGKRRKPKLQQRRKAIQVEMAKRKRSKVNNEKEQSKRKRKRLRQALRAATVPYLPEHKTLLVGEGDFSFTQSLLKRWEAEEEDELCGFNVVSTCYDSKRTLYEKYSSAKSAIKYVKSKGCTVLPEVDCTQLSTNKRVLEALSVISSKVSDAKLNTFDRIVFNFPHLGCGVSDKAQSVKLHQDFLTRFLESAHTVLAGDGQLHITVKKGEPYDLWGVPKLAVGSGLFKLHNATDFFTELYVGYQHRRTVGAAFKSEAEGGPVANADISKKGARTYVLVPAKEESDNEDKE